MRVRVCTCVCVWVTCVGQRRASDVLLCKSLCFLRLRQGLSVGPELAVYSLLTAVGC